MLGAGYVTAAPAAADDVGPRVAQAEKKAPGPAQPPTAPPTAPAPPAPPAAPRPAPPPTPAAPVLTLDAPSVDLGEVEAGKRATVEITFVNTGGTPLSLDKKKLRSSCKCLTATVPRAPIAPGGRGVIRATFVAPAQAGPARHLLHVRYLVADKEERHAQVELTGTVKKRPRGGSPPRFQGRGFILS